MSLNPNSTGNVLFAIQNNSINCSIARQDKQCCYFLSNHEVAMDATHPAGDHHTSSGRAIFHPKTDAYTIANSPQLGTCTGTKITPFLNANLVSISLIFISPAFSCSDSGNPIPDARRFLWTYKRSSVGW